MEFVFGGVLYAVLVMAYLFNKDKINEIRFEEFIYWKKERRIRSRSNTLENLRNRK